MIRLCSLAIWTSVLMSLANVGIPAETVVARHILAPNTIISAADVKLLSLKQSGDFSKLKSVIGQEVRMTLYTDQAIQTEDISLPTLVFRNQIVQINFASGGLNITASGRAMARGGLGDRIQVMNITSKSVLFGQVQQNGSILVIN